MAHWKLPELYAAADPDGYDACARHGKNFVRYWRDDESGLTRAFALSVLHVVTDWSDFSRWNWTRWDRWLRA